MGSFEVESGALLVVDPCYLLKQLKEVPLARRVAELQAMHVTGGNGVRQWHHEVEVISVDSGQVGIFDRKQFRNAGVVPKDHSWKQKPIDPEDPWYSLCCDRTWGPEYAGVIPFGAVASSGYGDGAYEWEVVEDGNKEVVAIRVIFIEE